MSTSSSEKTFYKKGDIRITRTLIEVKNNRYLIRNIYSFKSDKKDPETETLKSYIFVACIIAFIGVLSRSDFLIFVGLIWFLLLISVLNNLKPTHKLIVTTNKGEEIVLETQDSQDMEDMKAALEQAIEI